MDGLYSYPENDFRYLAHHGIPGMRWYVRRYQNEDGTLTWAGKKRYARRSGRELNRSDQTRAEQKYHYIENMQYADWLKKKSGKLSAKKNKILEGNSDTTKTERQKARAEKKIAKIEKKQEKVNKLLNQSLAKATENNAKVKEMEKKIDKTIKKLTSEKYDIRKIPMQRTVDVKYIGNAYVYYHLPGTYYKVKAVKGVT